MVQMYQPTLVDSDHGGLWKDLSMKHRRIITTLAALTVAVGLTTSAHGQTSETTTATFTITSSSGSLGINAPDGTSASPLSLGSVTAGATTFTPTLGTVTVTDTRAAIVADWTATATGTHFDLQGTTATPSTDANQRVANTAILYTATPTVSSGTGTLTPPSGTLGVGALTVYAGSGSNTVTWNPTLTMTLLSTQVAGTYKGTITHSVS